MTTSDARLKARAIIIELAGYIRPRLTGDNWYPSDNQTGKFTIAEAAEDAIIIWSGIEARQGRRYSIYKGDVEIAVNTLRRRNDTTLAEKTYKVAHHGVLVDGWQKIADKAIKLANTRAEIAIVDENARRAASKAADEYRASLEDAVVAASLPDDCFEDWYGERRLVNCSPKLIDGELRLKVKQEVSVTAEQAALLFRIIGGKIQIRVEGDLMPKQWLAIRDIFKK